MAAVDVERARVSVKYLNKQLRKILNLYFTANYNVLMYLFLCGLQYVLIMQRIVLMI